MTAYVIIADSEKDPESPGTTTLFTKMRDNPIAQKECDAFASTNGTFTPRITGSYAITVMAGGGGGGGSTATNPGGDGKRGESVTLVQTLVAGTGYTYTLGAAGTGVDGANGNNGGNSVFNGVTTITMVGGLGGIVNGGTGTVGTIGEHLDGYGRGGYGDAGVADGDDALGFGAGGGGSGKAVSVKGGSGSPGFIMFQLTLV